MEFYGKALLDLVDGAITAEEADKGKEKEQESDEAGSQDGSSDHLSVDQDGPDVDLCCGSRWTAARPTEREGEDRPPRRIKASASEAIAARCIIAGTTSGWP